MTFLIGAVADDAVGCMVPTTPEAQLLHEAKGLSPPFVLNDVGLVGAVSGLLEAAAAVEREQRLRLPLDLRSEDVGEACEWERDEESGEAIVEVVEDDTSSWTPCSPPLYSFRESRRKVSDAGFCNPDQTLIIFDWDDTLCPSSMCMEGHGLLNALPPLEGSDLERQLHSFSRDVKTLIQSAGHYAAQVAIITNGGERWVEMSCQAWMPELVPELEEVWISSARANWEPRGVVSPTGWKTNEFRNVIDRFYSQYENQSWKNVICIGDAPYEHEALRRVVEDGLGQQSTHCRTKCVKFLSKPSIRELGFQVRKLADNLDSVVYHDGDINIDFRIPFNFESIILE
mmetsp:Transcript_119025/g.379592  ORF Transcript_119025/g.379592 Transcript_119025/m.379592 type:complete len:343 (-) Transcript_119025:151-1179(-)